MPEYTYEALNKGGKQVKGVTQAGSEDAIIAKLRNMGYYPISVRLNARKTGQRDVLALPILRIIFHRVRLKHVTTFTRQFATLIEAGLPILRALAILQEQTHSVVFKRKIGEISKDIEAGLTLSDALSRHPRIFDKLYVNMVRAGEVGGALETVLNKIAEFLEKRQAIIGKIRSAMMYPVVVSLLATSIVAFILVWIVPRFKAVYDDLGAELPFPTQVLVQIGYVLVHQAWVVALAIVALWFIYKRINRTREGKYLFDRVKLTIPVFGMLLRKTAIVRFSSTLATLMTSGVPILQALDIVRETSGNEVVTRSMERVYQSVKDGETIHEPLARCSVFPPLVVHMVAVGEETGAIDQMLNKVAEAYSREVDDTVSALTSIIEPLLMVFLGILVGAIVIALYLPIFILPGAINNQL